jgi:hypothetical protein
MQWFAEIGSDRWRFCTATNPSNMLDSVCSFETLGRSSRTQHGDIGTAIRVADSETGTPIMQRRVVDTLGQMLNNGSITREMHEAGCIFRTLFRRAALDGIATSQFVRIAASSGDWLSVSQLDARRRVLNALDALGGIDSPGVSIAWHVVGIEVSLRAWSAQQGGNGRLVSAPIACGILFAALGTLANHFGLLPRSNAA